MTMKLPQLANRRAIFTQLSTTASEALALMTMRNKTAGALMYALCSLMAGSGGVVMATRETLAEILGGVSPRSIDRALKVLIEEGYIQRIRVGSSVGVAINARVAWVGARGELLQRAVFQATVVASRNDQTAADLEPRPMKPVPVLGPDEIPVLVGDGLDPPSQPGLDGIPPTAIHKPRSKS